MRIFDKDGRSDPLTCANKQIEVLQEKLAKANERVKDLTKENLSIVNGFNKYSFNDVKVDFSAQLNKFAIEKKIEGVNWFSENYCDDEHSFLADKAIEQLHKEQDNS